MYKLSIALLTLIFINCNSETKTKEESNMEAAKTDDGWEWLFDGKTTNGWHSYGKDSIGSAWKVNDSSLYLDTAVKNGWQVRDGGDIVTDNEYENFDLKLEWKISAKGNSGIIFYVKEDTSKYKQTWHTGPEMQVLDNAGHADAAIPKHRAGDLYDLMAVSKETVKPAGEWNDVEIISNNGRLDFYLNKEHVLSTMMWDDAWKKMIAGSKFKAMKDFGTFKSGKISLQDHGDEVWYRNIKIKRL